MMSGGVVVGLPGRSVGACAAYGALGSKVTLISSRDRVLPGEDEDAARVIEDVFTRNGMTVLSTSRADSVEGTTSTMKPSSLQIAAREALEEAVGVAAATA